MNELHLLNFAVFIKDMQLFLCCANVKMKERNIKLCIRLK